MVLTSPKRVEVVALVLLAAVTVTAVAGPFFYNQMVKGEAAQAHVFYVTAKQWEFEPSDFTVKQGENVTFIITSDDVRHGFGIVNYSIAVDADPGKYTRVSFIADQAGTFQILCFVYCGETFPDSGRGHPTMRGTLTVVGAQ